MVLLRFIYRFLRWVMKSRGRPQSQGGWFSNPFQFIWSVLRRVFSIFSSASRSSPPASQKNDKSTQKKQMNILWIRLFLIISMNIWHLLLCVQHCLLMILKKWHYQWNLQPDFGMRWVTTYVHWKNPLIGRQQREVRSLIL